VTLPTFLGIGAQRAGTTWIDGLLRTHPEVYLPARRKEVHYFDVHSARGRAWYEAFFPAEAERYRARGEITPRYLFEPAAPGRIARELPGVRLFAILRDPVDRAYSQFALAQRDEAFRGSFEEFLERFPDAIGRGLYHLQLARYLERFERERVHLLLFERATREPAAALRALATFLGVAPEGFDAARLASSANPGGAVRLGRAYALSRRAGDWLRARDLDAPVEWAKRLGVRRLFGRRAPPPPLAPAARARLWEAFADDAARLAETFALDLSCWGPRA
jgi:hypothetical protein